MAHSLIAFAEVPGLQDEPVVQRSITKGVASPVQWTFDQPSDDPARSYLCWFYFSDIQNANTVAFNFKSGPSPGGSTQWRPNAQFMSALAAATGTAPASTITVAAATVTASEGPAAPSAGLSAGAAAGIGVGVTAAIALVALGALLWLLHKRKVEADLARRRNEPGIENPPLK